MALVLSLKRGATTLDLQAGSPGAQLLTGWRPRTATPQTGRDPDPLVEQLTLLVHGTSDDNLAARLQSLHDMQTWAAAYMQDATEATPVWLHCKLDGETNERRALVRRIDLAPRSGWFEPDVVNSDVEVVLSIEREPYWEDTTTFSGATTVIAAGAAAVAMDYTNVVGDITGDVDARLALLHVVNPAGAGTLGRFWFGLRSANKHGTLANFVPIWECEDTDATLGTDAVRAADAAASPGGAGNTRLTITPGTATWAKRLSIHLGDVTANPLDNEGRFLWLLRCGVSAGKYEVQLRFGYAGMADALFAQGPVVEVANTGYDYKAMGPSSIPVSTLRMEAAPTAIQIAAYQVQVWARRTSGAGTLHLDCLVPLPIDEGSLTISNANLRPTVGNASTMDIHCTPEGTWIGATDGYQDYANNHYQGCPVIQADGFSFPPGDGRLVMAYAYDTSSTLTDYPSSVTPTLYRRWLTLRGAE